MNQDIDQIIKWMVFGEIYQLTVLGISESYGKNNNERMPKRLLHGNIIGDRKKGRPRKKWLQWSRI
jgi:hypothetical protein